jgi:hypothetical protein
MVRRGGLSHLQGRTGPSATRTHPIAQASTDNATWKLIESIFLTLDGVISRSELDPATLAPRRCGYLCVTDSVPRAAG